MYSLIARCLKGEASAGDKQCLDHLIKNDSFAKREYNFFKTVFQHETADGTADLLSRQQYISKKFDRITRRLRDEGDL